MGYVRGYEPGDAESLAPRMREADQAEVFAATGGSPLSALRHGAWASDPLYTIVDNSGEVAGMFGALPSEDGLSAAVWMLGSNAITQSSLRWQFIRECKQHVEKLNDQYPLLYGKIDVRNTVHMRWLSWMGFRFIHLIPRYGFEGRPFMEFVRIKQCAIQQQH